MARQLFESALMLAGLLLYVGMGYAALCGDRRTRRSVILFWLWTVVWTVAVVLTVLAIWGIIVVPGHRQPSSSFDWLWPDA
jgi:hypothetical protein